MNKLSFIIPTYNVEKYIERCLQSIISINIPENEYEIIVVDDGSTDKIKETLLKYPKVKSYFYDKPSGFAGRPRNKGIEMSTGTHIAFIDPDDWYVGSTIYDNFKLYKEKHDIIINSFQFSSKGNKRIIQKYNRKKYLWDQLRSVMLQRMVFSKKIISENNIKFVENCRGQDLIFLYDVYSVTRNIKFNKEISTMYLDNRLSSVSNSINDKYLYTSLILFDELYEHLINKLSDDELYDLIAEHFGYYYYVLKNNNKLSNDLKRNIKTRKFYLFLKDK